MVVAIALTMTFAQTKSPRQKPSPQKPQTPKTQPETTPAEPQEVDILKTDTDLVTVPVTATDRGGVSITDLVRKSLQLRKTESRSRSPSLEKFRRRFTLC